jgi:hypothetical protein
VIFTVTASMDILLRSWGQLKSAILHAANLGEGNQLVPKLKPRHMIALASNHQNASACCCSAQPRGITRLNAIGFITCAETGKWKDAKAEEAQLIWTFFGTFLRQGFEDRYPLAGSGSSWLSFISPVMDDCVAAI